MVGIAYLPTLSEPYYNESGNSSNIPYQGLEDKIMILSIDYKNIIYTVFAPRTCIPNQLL